LALFSLSLSLSLPPTPAVPYPAAQSGPTMALMRAVGC